MKSLISFFGLVLGLWAGTASLFAQTDDPALLVRVEGDVQQVRVEAYDANVSRWIALASGYREADGPGWLKIALPEGYESANLRVQASEQVSPFAGKLSRPALPDAVYVDYPPSFRSFMAEDTAGGGDSEPVIEEADIWAWEDSILYFYNQYRGLQVLDLADKSNPVWLDDFRYPAKGEDLYAVGDGRVILIGTGYYWMGEQLTLQILDFDGSDISLADTVELPAGYYMDSRRYNDHLYIMTREWVEQLDPDNRRIYAPRIHLYTVALQDGLENRIVDHRSFDGDGWLDAVLTAQPDGILLSLNKWYRPHDELNNYAWRTEVHVLAPGLDGVPQELGVARLSGILHDKFKMNFSDGILTTISQQANWWTGQFTRNTRLENFQLGENGFTRVGSLELAPGETLFATRFYGDNVYVVTFLFVDPLFSIDNSNPAHPVIAGELEVPGWSNYIEWVDEWLFAIGVEESQLTVSMFDVADPANMSLLDREYLGLDSWAWSEAQYDDQAVSFFPESGLMMLPFTSWSWKSPVEMIEAMQLLTWDATGLALRGQIQHLDVPRRGVLVGDTVVTISGRELVTTDVSDPDVPAQLGGETLAWNVQHLLQHKEHWLQLESLDTSYGYYIWSYPFNYQSQLDPVLYVTSVTEPNVPVAEIPLETGVLLGVVLEGDRLVLLQDISPVPEADPWTLPEKQSVAVRVYDVADPLNPELLGETRKEDLPYLGSRFEGRVMAGGSVLWYSDFTPFYGIYMLDFWPGPMYYQNSLSYLVSTFDGTGIPSLPAWDTYPIFDYYNQASAWHWEAPYLLASLTRYYQHERPDSYTDYEARSSLVAVDLSVPAEPVELPRNPIPYGLSAVNPLPGGGYYHLYFEPKWNMVEVWGWDRATAFPLFRQKLEEEDSRSYTLDWMAPFHLRSHYENADGQTTSFLHAWYHHVESNRFRKMAEFEIDGGWIRHRAVHEPYYLLTTQDEILQFKAQAETGRFGLKATEGLPFPNIPSMNLESAAPYGMSLYIPAGMYGVDKVGLSFLEPPSEAVVYPAADSVVEAAWTTMDPGKWQRVQRSVSDAVGIMDRLQWMYRADAMVEPDPDALDEGDFWRHSSWLGWYAHYAGQPEWVSHLEHGPLWMGGANLSAVEGLYFHAPGLGMVWTHSTLYPYLYSFRRGQWIYYVPETGLQGRRWFYALSGQWFGLVNGG